MSRSVESSFGNSIERVITCGLGRVVEEQLPIITMSYTDTYVLSALRLEATRSRVNFASTRHGVKDGWRRVNRARFFPESDNRTVSTAIASRLLRSQVLTPYMHQLAGHINRGVFNAGVWGHIPEFISWRSNRIGVNIMDGEPDLPARIAPHVDTPKESGVVVVLELGLGDANGISTNDNLTLIPGFDVCERLGTKQAIHGGEDVYDTRFSITFANLQI